MANPLALFIAIFLGHQAPVPDSSFGNRPMDRPGSTERDIHQTLCARKLLSSSRELAVLNLVVRCRSGILTVAGPVQDKETMLRVTKLLEDIRGVEKIRNEMYVGPMGVRPAALLAGGFSTGPVEVETRRNPLPGSLSGIQGPGSLTSGNSVEYSRGPGSVMGRGSVKPAAFGEPGLAILELIRNEPKFAGVHYSLNQGIIVLEANGGAEITMEFANRLAKVPGIRGVRIAQD